MDARQERGKLLAQGQGQRIRHVEGALWFVPAHDGGGYLVDVATGRCSCPDAQPQPNQQTPTKCKHQWAVEIVRGRATSEGAADATDKREIAKVPTPKMGRMVDFSADEMANLRKALNFLRIRCGGWVPLAKALRLTRACLQQRKISARVAVRLARFAGVALETVLAGKYPPAGTCAHCGYRPR